VRLVSSAPHRPRSRQSGAYTVEFALTILPLILVTVGTIDASRMVVSRLMLSYAVICGARAGLVNSTPDTAHVQTAVAAAAPMLSLGPISVSTSAASWTGRLSGDTVTVQATYTFTPCLGPMMGFMNKTFTAKSVETIP
jgi:Flp pilus assembly protein TadG